MHAEHAIGPPGRRRERRDGDRRGIRREDRLFWRECVELSKRALFRPYVLDDRFHDETCRGEIFEPLGRREPRENLIAFARRELALLGEFREALLDDLARATKRGGRDVREH